jgi:ABC-2 type transport system ATP-binding protein
LKNKKARVEEMIELTGLTRESSKRISALSKGYRQRVGLAQALIHDPSVLILDEPTSGLDPNQIVEIRDLIKKVGKEKTVMLSTHIMQEVEAICDKVIIIDKGKIVAQEDIANTSNILKEENLVIQIEFNTNIKAELLKANLQVLEVVNTKDNIWVLKVKKDIRSDLFELAVKNNLKVLSMNLVEKTLEQIFQEITK